MVVVFPVCVAGPLLGPVVVPCSSYAHGLSSGHQADVAAPDAQLPASRLMVTHSPPHTQQVIHLSPPHSDSAGSSQRINVAPIPRKGWNVRPAG